MKHRLLILLYAIFCLSSCQENYSNALVIHYYQLDESLKKSNEFIDFATDDLITTMAETCKTKVQYYPLVDKAILVAKQAADLAVFIDSLKAKMIEETGGLYTKEDALAAQDSLLEGLPKGAKNTSIANKILLVGTYDYKNKFPKAVLLDQKIQALSSQYLDVLESCWEENTIKGSIFADVRKKENTIQALKDQFTLNSSKHPIVTANENQTWAENNFENKPLMLVLNNLTAIQNQLKTTQYVLVDFFSRQVERVNHAYDYDRFEILAYSLKPSVRLGETYKAEIALGAYSSKSIFEVVINQDTIHSVDGKAIYRVRPNKVGEQEYEAQISITYPATGYSETFRKTFSFQVIP
jgi:hypothetical protein